jgi:hypothetical protein
MLTQEQHATRGSLRSCHNHVSLLNDLMKCPERFWPENAKLMVQKYAPLMKIRFGE